MKSLQIFLVLILLGTTTQTHAMLPGKTYHWRRTGMAHRTTAGAYNITALTEMLASAQLAASGEHSAASIGLYPPAKCIICRSACPRGQVFCGKLHDFSQEDLK